MSQEPYNKDERRSPRFNNRPGDDPNQPPKKGPRFSIYWVYAIIFALLIGFQLFSPFSPNMLEVTQDRFLEVLKQGDVEKYTVISNKDKVKVTLKESSVPKYKKEIEDIQETPEDIRRKMVEKLQILKEEKEKEKKGIQSPLCNYFCNSFCNCSL